MKELLKARVLKLGQVYIKVGATKHTEVFRTFRYLKNKIELISLHL